MIARFGLKGDKDVRYIDMSEVSLIRGLHVERDSDNDLTVNIYVVKKNDDELTLSRVMYTAEYANKRKSIFQGGGFVKELVKINRNEWEAHPVYLEMEELLDYLIDKWHSSI